MKIPGYLIVYKCIDNGEEEACFFEQSFVNASNYIAYAAPPPGFEHREGYYFIEDSVLYS